MYVGFISIFTNTILPFTVEPSCFNSAIVFTSTMLAPTSFPLLPSLLPSDVIFKGIFAPFTIA